MVVCADSAEEAGLLVPVGQQVAARLGKGIILLSCHPEAKGWIEMFGVPFVALHSDWPSAINALPTAFNAILAITLSDPDAGRHSFTHPRQILKNYRQCKIAYLAIAKGWRPENPTWPERVALTLNHQRESKEKLIWASYFARFFGSHIVVMHHPYKDAAFRSRWNNNMRYLEKVFSGLGLDYDTHPLEGGSEFGNPDLAAVKEEGIDLFITLVADQREKDLGDLFTPPAELKLLKKGNRRPILFLNQRDDLYILCD